MFRCFDGVVSFLGTGRWDRRWSLVLDFWTNDVVVSWRVEYGTRVAGFLFIPSHGMVTAFPLPCVTMERLVHSRTFAVDLVWIQGVWITL